MPSFQNAGSLPWSALLLATLTGACAPVLAAITSDEPIAPPPPVTAVPAPAVHLAPMFDGETFARPVDAQQAPGDPDTWFVVEQAGTIWRLAPRRGGEGWVRRVFLDVTERVSRRHNEEGLLGLAFSPHFGTEGHPHERAFYVNYSARPGDRRSVLSRFFAGGRRVPADPGAEEVLLEVPQPYGNHNGGGLVFGPDGFLYWSLGDGGAANDPHDHGQNAGTLLGTILRLDVGPTAATDDPEGRPYGIPADNPLVHRDDARPELFAYGLRNAWRFSFDRETGDLWAADVGQDKYEYVFVIEPGGNHGWRLLEGFHRFMLPAGSTLPPGLTPPVFEYPHSDGLSITGGFVYRGEAIEALRGWYVFADYVTRRIWVLRPLPEGGYAHAELLDEAAFVSSFAQGHDGELLVLDHMGTRKVWRLAAGEAPIR